VFEDEPWTNSWSSEGARNPWRYEANALAASVISHETPTFGVRWSKLTVADGGRRCAPVWTGRSLDS
jgi:hypothetical protein